MFDEGVGDKHLQCISTDRLFYIIDKMIIGCRHFVNNRVNCNTNTTALLFTITIEKDVYVG